MRPSTPVSPSSTPRTSTAPSPERRRPSSVRCSRAIATTSCWPRSSGTSATTWATGLRPARKAVGRTSAAPSRSPCGGCRPITSTSTSCTRPIRSPRSRRPSPRCTSSSWTARCATSGAPTSAAGRSRRPTTWPRRVATRASSRLRTTGRCWSATWNARWCRQPSTTESASCRTSPWPTVCSRARCVVGSRRRRARGCPRPAPRVTSPKPSSTWSSGSKRGRTSTTARCSRSRSPACWHSRPPGRSSPGATSAEQVRANAAAGAWELTDDEVVDLEQILAV